MAKQVKVALDWTPNTNHVGFYVARAKGFFADVGLDVQLIDPACDGYKATPASRLVSGEAVLAIAPKETVVSYFTAPPSRAATHPRLRAVATVMQSNTSAIVTLKSSGIDRPKLLDGKKYASYGARYEGRIVQQLIKNDGGSGQYDEIVEPMLSLWDSVVSGKYDSTWVFMGWEGIEAQQKGIDLNVFMLQDFNVPYGEGPMIIALDSECKAGSDAAKVIAAAAKGYQWAVEHPEEAGKILMEEAAKDGVNLPEKLCVDSMKYIKDFMLDKDGKWGRLQDSTFAGFVQWLHDNGLLTTKMQSREGATNETASLDGLRSGDVGDLIPVEKVPASELYTNEFLP